ncbi:MAG: (Fe-S)-binding protein [Gammaproteobacteria bacterium]|nr:(Fe-S)-binding protein [Gammaproteobacteria bacterium]
MSIAESFNKQEIIDATDQCVMCGLCLPHCPTYTLAQTEPESPRGRIALVRALYEGKLDSSETIISHLGNCLTCMNCEHVCPANVNYEKIIDAGRAVTYMQNSLLGLSQQSTLLFALSNARARKFFKACIYIFRTLGLIRLLPKTRLFSLLPETNNTLANITAHKSNGPTIAIINSCAGDLVSDETLTAATLVLSKLGYSVVEQKQTLCCGALHQHSGDLKTAKELRQKFIHSINQQNPYYLVSLATGCGAQIKRYAELDDISAEQLSKKIFDVNEFVLQQINKTSLSFRPLAKKVYLHKPCSQAQVINDATVVEQLLNNIPEIELVTFEDKLACCGAGGMNTLAQSELAKHLVENKILELKNTTANCLVSSNIGCALHFQAQLKNENTHVQVCHPITLLAQQMV